ncbi:MAG: cyclic nucleotide-binding domain-containing protein [Planctomycetaceae bacterium]|nr:cyclic nucleotide-binding domain-containing protein [Planctomycetaceae bacterium]
MSEQEFGVGDVFFSRGDAGDCAYLLHEGAVELLDGPRNVARRLGPGTVFGEMGLIEERPRDCTARAASPGRVTVMTRDEFEDGLVRQPGRTLPYVRALFERLRSLATTTAVGDAGSTAASPPESTSMIVSQPEGALPLGAGEASEWIVDVHPLTHRAAETLPENGLRVAQFPLRIGRASDGAESEARDLNDLWLIDQKPYHVSRNHCEIVIDEHGPIVRDRGSYLGCIVNDEPIGGRIVVSAARLSPGENVLVIGTRMSKYQFRVIVSARADG